MVIPDLKTGQRRDANLMSGEALEERLQYYQTSFQYCFYIPGVSSSNNG